MILILHFIGNRARYYYYYYPRPYSNIILYDLPYSAKGIRGDMDKPHQK